MTQLLVSVRNASEAESALAGGADLIDIKEPSRGALGAADEAVWREVLATVGGRAPVSAALGELLELDGPIATPALEGFTFVKAGLAGAANDEHWQQHLAALHRELPDTTKLVAVAYADHTHAAAPNPWRVLDAAISLRLPALLVDTFDKRRGDLWSALSDEAVGEIVRAAQRVGVAVALAGSLTLATVPRAAQHSPDWIAVRGAACLAGRDSVIDVARISALKQAIASADAIR